MPTRPRADAPAVVLHWLLVLGLILCLGTGLRIGAEDAFVSRMLSPILMQGDVLALHFMGAAMLAFTAVLYVAYLWRAMLGSRVWLSTAVLAARDRQTRWAAIDPICYWAYWVAFALLLVSGITGGLLYAVPWMAASRALLAVHLGAAAGIITYLGVHIAAQLLWGGWRQLQKIVSPRSHTSARRWVPQVFRSRP